MPGLPARRTALAILSEVLRAHRPLDSVQDKICARAKLDARDAAFARAIAAETLRRFGQLDALIKQFLAKPLAPHRAGPALEILLAGACEILFLKVPPHAAVDAANRLAQENAGALHFKGLINAVLRRIAREGETVLQTQDTPRCATPDWLWRRWSQHYGEETARAIATAHLSRPPLDLTLKQAGDPCTDFIGGVRLPPGTLRLYDAGPVESLPGYAQGRWWVQDFAASLPARLAGDVRGKQILDLCAAPGGKTAQFAAAGGIVTAIDSRAERLDIVARNLARLDLAAHLVYADARDWRPGRPADCVLLDAPCTATGTIRRHPDLPWIKSAADVGIAATLQRDLIDAAAGMTAPGGLLLYVVCSLEPEEGIEQVESFLARHSNFQRARVDKIEVPDPLFVTDGGDLRTLPHFWGDKGGVDGFYAARLQRTE